MNRDSQRHLSSNEKVYIETPADLYKIPISTLKNTKIYNFKGKYFDKLYEEALKIERSDAMVEFHSKQKEFQIAKIIFEIPYSTNFGEHLAIAGSLDSLGKWEKGRELNLQWTEGNVWKGEVGLTDHSNFEYKFVLKENGSIRKWEAGENRTFNYEMMKSLIESSTNKTNDVIKIDNLNDQDFLYDNKTQILTVVSTWRL